MSVKLNSTTSIGFEFTFKTSLKANYINDSLNFKEQLDIILSISERH